MRILSGVVPDGWPLDVMPPREAGVSAVCPHAALPPKKKWAAAPTRARHSGFLTHFAFFLKRVCVVTTTQLNQGNEIRPRRLLAVRTAERRVGDGKVAVDAKRARRKAGTLDGPRATLLPRRRQRAAQGVGVARGDEHAARKASRWLDAPRARRGGCDDARFAQAVVEEERACGLERAAQLDENALALVEELEYRPCAPRRGQLPALQRAPSARTVKHDGVEEACGQQPQSGPRAASALLLLLHTGGCTARVHIVKVAHQLLGRCAAIGEHPRGPERKRGLILVAGAADQQPHVGRRRFKETMQQVRVVHAAGAMLTTSRRHAARPLGPARGARRAVR